jgi:endonuclease III
MVCKERQKIEDELSEINQHDFWKSIWKIGIANGRKNCIPLAVMDNDGSIKTDKNDVLNKHTVRSRKT